MVSTIGDLHRFAAALLCGELFPPDRQEEMVGERVEPYSPVAQSINSASAEQPQP
ncbi:hypothetical protein [Micromonospora citrea]|uniref:hypothetical protein n=1 Tax=Micromonospora citrea TaxID=47855 RepID=UPI00159F06A3|nr:hypothetical protein [Micromonospora citrea]